MPHTKDEAEAARKNESSGSSNPQHVVTDEEMQECITGCLACRAICLQTVDHCLAMGGAHVAQQHVRLLLDCAELCQTSVHFMITHSPLEARIWALCAEACRACEAACRKMGDTMDLRCAESCPRCAEMLRHLS